MFRPQHDRQMPGQMRRYNLLNPMHLYLDRVMGADADSIWMQVQKKGRKNPDTEAKCYKSPEPPGEVQFSKLLIWTFMWYKRLSMRCCVEAFSQWKPERIFDIWKLKASVGTLVFLFSCHGPAVSPCLDDPWWWMLLVLLTVPGSIIKMRLPQLHRFDELVTPCPTHYHRKPDFAY